MGENQRGLTPSGRGLGRYWQRISHGAGRSIILGVLTILVLIAAQVLSQRQSHDQKVNVLNQELDNGSRDIASRLASSRDFLERLASAREARSLSENAFRELTDQHIRANPEVVEIAYLSRNGKEQWNARGLPLPEVLAKEGPSSPESELFEILSRVLAKASKKAIPPTPPPPAREEAAPPVPLSQPSSDEKSLPPQAHLIQLSETFGGGVVLALESSVIKGSRVEGSFFAAVDLKQLVSVALKPNLRDNFATEFAIAPGTPVASLGGYSLVKEQTPNGRTLSGQILVSQRDLADLNYVASRSFQLSGYNFSLTLMRLREPGSGFASFLTATSVAFALALLWSILILVRDSTRSRELGIQLEAARLEAEKVSRAKSELIANVSHELRTPLGSIEGYSNLLEDLLRKQGVSGSWPELLSAIRRNTGNLFELVDELLDMSKLEAGLFQAERSEIDLGRFLSDIATVISPAASSKQLHFSVKGETPLPLAFEADERRMRQILLNLLSNAVKFTDAGAVELRVAYWPASGMLVFEVSDSGPGISKSFLPRLFAPFQQEDGSVSRRYGGTGLGLALSKKIATGLRAELELVSNGSEGAVFAFRVPVGRVSGASKPLEQIMDQGASERVPERRSLHRLDGVHVLIVEDCPDTQRIMASYLESAGARVLLVSTGLSALELLKRRREADAKLPDVILIDLQMPGWDGFRTLLELRNFGFEGVSFALSATAFHNVRERAIALGCRDFFLKPVDPGALTFALAKSLESPLPRKTKRRALPAGTRETLERLRPQFLAGLAQRLRTIQNSLESREAEELGKAVHQLKGASRMYGFERLAKYADQLEKALARDSVSWAELGRTFERLKESAAVESHDHGENREGDTQQGVSLPPVFAQASHNLAGGDDDGRAS